MKRIAVLALVLVSACNSSSDRVSESTSIDSQSPIAQLQPIEVSEADRILEAACDFLWKQQRPDGSWGSETYGILKSGQAYTPFVLYALLQCDHDPHVAAIDDALAFMRSTIKQGAIGLADPDVTEYPVYSTAYALMCFKIAGNAEDRSLIKTMEDYLVSEQFVEHRGFDRSHPAYGGWGFGGNQPDGQTGHMDLAHVRRVLDALALQPVNAQRLAAVRARAEVFLKMVQKHPTDSRPQPLPAGIPTSTASQPGFDGGFYFSPVVLRANKGRMNQSAAPCWRSYSTATCDGLLALLSADVDSSDERVADAIRWLNNHGELEYSQGIPEFYEGENWRDAVTFYHLSVRGEVARALGDPVNMRRRIGQILASLQDPDGSFVNRKSSLMKEDDPIMTTALAIVGLGPQPCRVR